MGRDVERRFIGRQSELDTRHAALECAVSGQPRVVLLTGEPGIGKTRTAQELASHAERRGVLALWGRCPEEPGAPPYWPWLQLIRRDLMESGDTPLAAATARYHLVTGETTREPFIEAVALAALAMIATHEGRFAEAEQWALRALRCGERFDRANAAGIFGVQMFTIRRQQGRLRELAPVLRKFLDSETQGAIWLPGLAAVRFARAHQFPVSVRGGGHNIAGLAVCEGGLMIDLSLMKGVWVDLKGRTVRAQAGCTLGDVDRETQLHDLAAVLDFYRRFTAETPRETTCVAVLRIAPPAPWLPKEIHGQPIVVVFVCHSGDIDEGERIVAPLRALGRPVADIVTRRPYTQMQSLLDATQPKGRRYYWKSHYLPGVDAKAIEVVIDHAARMPSPYSAIIFFQLQGALGELPAGHSPAGNRDVAFVLNFASSWENAADDALNVRWTRDGFEATRAFSTGGTYINFLTEEEGRDRIEAAYGKPILEQLGVLKKKYDPDNMFRHTKNIAGCA